MTMPSSPAAHDEPSDASDEETALSNQGDPSQACFVLHPGGSKPLKNSSSYVDQSPKKTASSNKRKRAAKQNILPFSLPPCFVDEPQECGVWRMEAFQNTWKEIEDGIKEAFEVYNTKIFKDIQKFVHDTLFYDAQLELYLSSKTSTSCASARVSKQLHAALLYLRNVDSSDHTKTFVQLKTYLKESHCYVANLLPHNFSSKAGVGAPLHNMMKQIVGFSPDTADMDVLASWHREASNVKSPIVIIIEDAELCSSSVLAEFIVILSEWIAELPLVLIMGMTTSGEAIQKLLPGSAARHLHLHNFKLPSPNQYLEGILRGVLLKPTPVFTVGSEVLNYLLIHYQKYDSTVTSFLRALKMACMEHFVSQPLSFLCTSSQDTSIESLKTTLLHHATLLPSLQSKQFNNDNDVGKEMAMALRKLRERKERWNVTIQCLLAASTLLEVDSLKIFSETLEQQVHKAEVNQGTGITNGNTIRLGQYTDTNTTMSMLKKLRDAPEPIVHKMLTKWIQLAENVKEWRAEAQNLLNKLASEAPSLSRVEGPSNSCNGSARAKQLLVSVDEMLEEEQGNTASNLDGSGTNTSRQKEVFIDFATVAFETDPSNVTRIVDSLARQKKPVAKVHGKMAANLLEHMMREHLIPLESLPFHEILCYTNVGSIKQVLMAEPRRAIQWNVEHPVTSLKCECCSLDAGKLSSSMNDSSILLRLAQKCGDQANLFDLYQSFSTALSSSLVGDKQGNSRKGLIKSPKKVAQQDMDKTLVQARFCKAASELQLVGLFRMASKKRSDSVQLAM